MEQGGSTILAIDPGYDRCGVAMISIETKPQVLFSCCITTNKTASQEQRLAHIFAELSSIQQEWHPQAIALETLFFSVNKKTALKVAEARGLVLLLAGIHETTLVELSPQEVKLGITGVGNADKEQVKKMVALTTGIALDEKLDDEIDAIALGLAAVGTFRLTRLQKDL